MTEVRRLAWRHLATIIQQTGTRQLLPESLAAILAEVSPGAEAGRPWGCL